MCGSSEASSALVSSEISMESYGTLNVSCDLSLNTFDVKIIRAQKTQDREYTLKQEPGTKQCTNPSMQTQPTYMDTGNYFPKQTANESVAAHDAIYRGGLVPAIQRLAGDTCPPVGASDACRGAKRKMRHACQHSFSLLV